MTFSDATKVTEVVGVMRDADKIRSQNRARINDLFNGLPPWTQKEADENRVSTNVNFLEPTRIAHEARRQFINAFLKPTTPFKVTLQNGPVHKRYEWSGIITKAITRLLKKSRPYMESMRGVGAQLTLHGIGPMIWQTREEWRPRLVGIEDILIPSGTTLEMDNLEHFAIYRRLTPAYLFSVANGKGAETGWNVKLIKELLAELVKQHGKVGLDQNYDFAEKLAEDYKANAGYYVSDVLPTLNVWDFYFYDEEAAHWERRMIVADTSYTPRDTEFIFNPKGKSYGESLGQIIHFQFADGNNVAPFRYHSVRSLGFLLYAVCHLQNRLRCRFADATFESMLWYFRNVASEDRERLLAVDLQHMGIIPEGLTIVPANERYKIDPNLLTLQLGQNRQLMSENSSSFIRDLDVSEGGPMTATETMARVNQSNALVSTMLQLAYNYEQFKAEEICRRLTIPNTRDKEARKFQEDCKKDGVPDAAMDVEKWDIEIQRVLGAGDRMVEMAQAQALMAVRPLLDPQSQREVLHLYVQANSEDPRLADRLIPLEGQTPSDSVTLANLAIATLMLGLPFMVTRSYNKVEYIETLMQLLAMLIQQTEQSGAMATPEKLLGFQATLQHLQQQIQLLAQDKDERQRVKMYGDQLGQLANYVKGYAQRLQEQQAAEAQASGGLPPEAQAKVQTMQAVAQTKMGIDEAKAEQKLRQKEQAFDAEQQRQDALAEGTLRRGADEGQARVDQMDLQGAAELRRKRMLSEIELRRKQQTQEQGE